MTNLEIIANEAVANGLLTEEQVEVMILTHGGLPYMTYAEWKYNGYQVKKGAKAVIKTKLWKMVKSKKEEQNEEGNKTNFIMVPASLFGADQVEKIAQA